MTKEDEPGDDLAGVLVQAAAAGEITDAEAVSLATAVYVSGGHAVRNNCGSMMYALLTHPEHLHRLRREPDLLPRAVEELFRYVPHRNGVGIPRIATRDVGIGGQMIRAGDVVCNSYLSAAILPSSPTPTSSTSTGRTPLTSASATAPTTALAATMARMEAETVIKSVLDHLPGLQLAVRAQDVEFLGKDPIRGPKSLPVAW
ncbi:hypothetical protein ACFVOR_36845 [Streptomyces sp. NPDC057837]|uniref:hypothetical protein n=1 Tax=Streptomyces sp. NPDC057837 TaxID=3346260 RepID=UPI0036A2BD12